MKRSVPDQPHIAEEEFVRSDALRNYCDTVRIMGGQPEALLAKVNIGATALETADAVFPYRSMIRLLELTASELDCPDFGLKLASHQEGTRVLGPLHVAMHNAKTVGDAFDYCAAHLRVYSSAIGIQMENDKPADRKFMRFEILLGGGTMQRQAVENALGLTHQAMHYLSHGTAGAAEVWFVHSRLAPMSVYREFFSAPVRFEKPFNAVFMNNCDLALQTSMHDQQVYELASSYIDLRFPPLPPVLAMRVRTLAARLLPMGQCTQEEVAEKLSIHPRTLQRKLKKEGTSFEQIKDEVRRDAALRYLSMPGIPFTRVASMLGYSESAVLIRSCQRWFANSPRMIREQLRKDPQKLAALGISSLQPTGSNRLQ